MRVLALDISTKTGWALLEGDKGTQPTVLARGHACNEMKVAEHGPYPFGFLHAANHMADKIIEIHNLQLPDVIIIEETNKSKARYSQKILEFIHCCVLANLIIADIDTPVFYINSSDWRKANDIYMGKEDKKNNAKVNKAKKQGKSKKELGLKGKITKKHLAVRAVQEKFGITFKQKENDVAEAILLGTAYFLGAPTCDGK